MNKSFFMFLLAATLANADTSPQVHNWTKAARPMAIAPKQGPKIHATQENKENIDYNQLLAKIENKQQLTHPELKAVHTIRTKYQANPIIFKGTIQEKIYRAVSKASKK